MVALLVMVQDWAPVDKFVWLKVKPYIMYVGLFVGTIYCNFMALEVSNIETLIVARSCVPCVVSILDFIFLGRTLPSLRSWCAMAIMIAGAVGYVLTDKAFELDGLAAYTWVVLYFCIISVEMAYGKHVVGPHLGFGSMWGPTLYTNTISIPPMVTIGLISGESSQLCKVAWSTGLVALILASCVIGVAISFLGFKVRSLVTATCFTILGVANKMLTVAGNVLVWDQHATPVGIAFLFVCLCGAAAYQQSPLRTDARQALVPSTEAQIVVQCDTAENSDVVDDKMEAAAEGSGIDQASACGKSPDGSPDPIHVGVRRI
eukprot:5113108-Prymnesium_polylepis.1